MIKALIPTILLVALAACSSQVKVPENPIPINHKPKIYPDYTEATVPVNICPLNFTIEEEADEFITHINTLDDPGSVISGKTIAFDPESIDWKCIISDGIYDSIYVHVYARKENKWHEYEAFCIAVAPDSIDQYISYRLLEPSYVNFEEMRICQRNLSNFDEDVILCNQAHSDGDNGQCINCHSYQDYNRNGNMQLHVRLNEGGTIIVKDGEQRKVNLKRPGLLSAGVYPSWHPTLPLIAYSNNTTGQNFHTRNSNKIEVQDNESDIILYDVDRDEVTVIANDSTELESFPYWNHDGTALYYVSASLPDSLCRADIPAYKTAHYKDYKYNIYRKSFNPETRTFGTTDTIFNAAAIGKSALMPRESPDGRYLLFSMAEYGTFHIWHHDADLYLLDLETGELRCLDEINSPDTESYHSWSSNGRWIIFSSRRDDGSYTRLYIAYFDEDGNVHKPFILPQRDPDYYQQLYKSYNVPEFMVDKAKLKKR